MKSTRRAKKLTKREIEPLQLTKREIDSLQQVIQYLWKDEYRDFIETFEIEPPFSDDSYSSWIERCENSSEILRNHIFYHLLILQQTLKEHNEKINLLVV